MNNTNKRWLVYLVVLAFFGGCVSQRISGALQRYGLDEKRSECVGNRLTETLSTEQLQSLSRASKAYKQASKMLKIADFLQVGSELNDSQIPLKISQAGLQCGLLSSDLLLLPLIN